MPKKPQISFSTWWKNFLTGVLATAIGVGLTFEVNNRVEHHKKQQAQRQTAMMVIYDIDDIINHFIRFKERDDAFYKVTMYLFTHQDELETVAMDSLWMTGEYLFHHTDNETPEWADISTEQVFTGSMDAILNLGDITFCDNVQKCYQLRGQMSKSMEQQSTFRRPLNEEFIFRYRKQLGESELDYSGMMNQHAMAGMLRLAFAQPEVMLYIRKYFTRDRAYQDFIDQLIYLNQENKFIMNVSDADMEKYIASHVNQTMPAKPKLIVGQWEMREDNQLRTYLFRKDQTVTATTQMGYKIGMYVEEEDINVSIVAPLTFTIDGQWNLEGDSLHFDFDPQTVQITSFELDLTNLPKSALERAKDSLDSRKQQYRESIQRQIQEKTLWCWANKISIAKSGNIMFCETQYTMPWGQTATNKKQLLKSCK